LRTELGEQFRTGATERGIAKDRATRAQNLAHKAVEVAD